MKSNYTFIIILILAITPLFEVFSQEHHEEHHHGHNNEVGFAIGLAPLLEENAIAPAFHLHYVKGLGHQKRFGIGPSFEMIFDEHRHYAFSFGVEYGLYKGFIVAYAPGLLLIKEEGETLKRFVQHIELAYEIDVKGVHIGPIADMAMEKEGVHFLLGVHIGFDF